MSYQNQLNLSWFLPSGLSLDIGTKEEWLLFSDIIINGEYQPAVDYCLTLPKERELTILDLGANVGFTSWFIADRLIRAGYMFRSLLVEPNPDTFQELSRRVKASSFKENIVVPICGLVGQRTGRSLLRTDGPHTISRVFTEAGINGEYTETPYIDLEFYLEEHEPIDLIKCDIEASEELFVESYPELLTRTKCIIMEIHHEAVDVEKIKKLLRSYGFSQHKTLLVKGLVSTEFFYKLPPFEYHATL